MSVENRLDAIESHLRKISLVQDQILTELIKSKDRATTQVAAPTLPALDKALYETAKLLRCPTCGGDMGVRRRRTDGNPFFGCNNFKDGCRGLLPADAVPLRKDIEAAARLREPIARKEGGPTRLAGFVRSEDYQPPPRDFSGDDSVPF